MRRFVTLIGLAAITLAASSVSARSHRTDDVPNSQNALFNPNGGMCGLCHESEEGRGPRSAFGAQVETGVAGVDDPAQWDRLYMLDADRDGYPNGLELGDPMGEFTEGGADPTGATIYNPNDRDSNPCGDGTVQADYEDCEADADITSTCEDLGYGPGTVVCTSCREDASGCEGFGVVNNVNNQNNVNNVNNANNQNNANNNQTTNTTNMTNAGDGDDDGGCATRSGDSSWPLIFLLGFFCVRRVFSPVTRRRVFSPAPRRRVFSSAPRIY